MKDILIGLLIALCIFFCVRMRRNAKTEYIRETVTDTVVIRDTLRYGIPEPYEVYVTRVDTVYVVTEKDSIPFEIPITRKVYEDENYRAEIEGYRPSLVSLDIYRKERLITNTQTVKVQSRKRFGVGVQVGYGIAGDKCAPYIGVGLQYSMISF